MAFRPPISGIEDVFDVITGVPQAIAFEDAEAQFAAYGNVFISYRSI